MSHIQATYAPSDVKGRVVVMTTHEPEGIPMEQIVYEVGTGPRYQLLAFTKDTHQLVRRYGGDPVLPNLGPQAHRLRTLERKAGFLVLEVGVWAGA